MLLRLISPLVVLGLASAFAWGDSPQRPDLNGTWRLEPSRSEIHSRPPGELTWKIEQNDDAFHLVEQTGDKNNGEIRCKTDGKDCKVKDEGRKATVSFYYNGPVLVEMESEGNQSAVTKKQMQVSSDGSTLTVDVIHIVPADRAPDKLVLTRQAGATGH